MFSHMRIIQGRIDLAWSVVFWHIMNDSSMMLLDIKMFRCVIFVMFLGKGNHISLFYHIFMNSSQQLKVTEDQ